MSRKTTRKDSYRDVETEYSVRPKWVDEFMIDHMETMTVISAMSGGWIGTEDERAVIDLEDAR